MIKIEDITVSHISTCICNKAEYISRYEIKEAGVIMDLISLFSMSINVDQLRKRTSAKNRLRTVVAVSIV